MENTTNEFNINDLVQLKNIVELASTRGAFRANEMLTVGTTFTRLENFLNAVLNQAQAQQADEVPADDQAQSQPQGEAE